MHVQELARLGADIRTQGDTALVRGVRELRAPKSWLPICALRCRW